MAIYYKLQTVGSGSGYTTDPDITLPENFQPRRLEITNTDATPANDAAFSFDGTNDAGLVKGGTGPNSQQLMLHQPGVKKIWFKKVTGSAPVVRVVAEH